MFNWFGNSELKREKRKYAQLMEQARDVLRSGDVVRHSEIIAQAEEVGARIDMLEAES